MWNKIWGNVILFNVFINRYQINGQYKRTEQLSASLADVMFRKNYKEDGKMQTVPLVWTECMGVGVGRGHGGHVLPLPFRYQKVPNAVIPFSFFSLVIFRFQQTVEVIVTRMLSCSLPCLTKIKIIYYVREFVKWRLCAALIGELDTTGVRTSTNQKQFNDILFYFSVKSWHPQVLDPSYWSPTLKSYWAHTFGVRVISRRDNVAHIDWQSYWNKKIQKFDFFCMATLFYKIIVFSL